MRAYTWKVFNQCACKEKLLEFVESSGVRFCASSANSSGGPLSGLLNASGLSFLVCGMGIFTVPNA